MANKYFPEHIFDGTHQDRKDLRSIINPNYIDYLVLSQELKATQDYLKKLAQNVEIMPDLDNYLNDSLEKISDLKKEVDELTPTTEMVDSISKIEKRLKEIDQRKNIAITRQEVLTLQSTIKKNQLEILKLKDSFSKDIRGFHNTLLNKFKQIEDQTNKKLEILQKQIDKINIQVELNTLLKKLDQED